MSVDMVPGESIKIGKPRVLFEGPFVTYDSGSVSAMYDISRDDQRFLMVKPVSEPPPVRELNVIVNGFQDLHLKAPK